jgi:hypothetical protein
VEVPEALGDLVKWDLSAFAFVGEGFSKSERYVDFQSKVRELARNVAEAIEKGDKARSPHA